MRSDKKINIELKYRNKLMQKLFVLCNYKLFDLRKENNERIKN